MKRIVASTIVAALTAFAAHAEWHYGIGTGLVRLNVDGDQGLNIRAAGVGPVEFEVDLEPDDVSDLMETAFGFGGYATDGQWVFQFGTGFLELRDGASRTLADGREVRAELFQEVTLGELSVGYVAHRSENVVITPYVGARYLKHELGAEARVDGTEANRSVDHDWVDARVGVGVDVPLAEKWVWGISAEAGFGGSDGTYEADTGVTWMFAEHWSARAGFNFTAIDFEEGNRGDDDWYLYDADEFGATLGVLYHF